MFRLTLLQGDRPGGDYPWNTDCYIPRCARAHFNQKGLRIMSKLVWATSLVLGISLRVSGVTAQSEAQCSVDDIRKELLQLPYYSVFDFLAFKYDKGTATLMGYAYHLV
jgi:hypothetical protein